MTLTAEGVAAQSRVSGLLNEAETPGYGILNLSGEWQVAPGVHLAGGIENLLDREHRQHLAGYNRVMGADVDVSERLPGTGRGVFVRFSLRR